MNAPNLSGWKPAMGVAGAAEDLIVTSSGDRGLALEEALIFELGRPGTSGVDMASGEGEVLPGLNRFLRAAPAALPGLSEPETVRHYTRLSRQNYAIDLGLFPLGSCTMKHNPRLNEKMARLPGFADIHPLQPVDTVQGALAVIDQLAERTGLTVRTLHHYDEIGLLKPAYVGANGYRYYERAEMLRLHVRRSLSMTTLTRSRKA